MVTKIAIAFQISVTGLLRCIRNKFDSVGKRKEREKGRERERKGVTYTVETGERNRNICEELIRKRKKHTH